MLIDRGHSSEWSFPLFYDEVPIMGYLSEVRKPVFPRLCGILAFTIYKYAIYAVHFGNFIHVDCIITQKL